MGKPAPPWWVEGVPRLDMPDHLKGRSPVKTTPVITTEGGSKTSGR